MTKQLLLLCKLAFLAWVLLSASLGSAQQLSPTAKISLLTCGAGEELYATFGHSAVRVNDTAQRLDVVFNYGTFDFSDPNFYSNFTRGKLNYMLSVASFSDFMREYKASERWVFEQLLRLDSTGNQNLFDFLVNNSQPANKYYRYDFLFDNCSSRIRDIFTKVFANQLTFSNVYIEGKPSFRQLLYPYLMSMPWSKLGIDLLLAYRVDRTATPYEYMFLPDHLCTAFRNAKLNGQPLVDAEKLINEVTTSKSGKSASLLAPIAVFSALLLLVAILSLLKLSLKLFDFLLFLIVGLLGAFLVFMWFGTEHYVTKGNLNLLWAIPFHAIAAWALLKRRTPRWARRYFALTTLLCILLLALWVILPQHLNYSLMPIVALLGFRSFKAYRPLRRRNVKKWELSSYHSTYD